MGFTLITWSQVAILPQLSIALHVRVIVKEPSAAQSVVSSRINSGVKIPEQLSLAVILAALASGILPQSTIMGSGQLIVGGVVSSILIIWLQVFLLPFTS